MIFRLKKIMREKNINYAQITKGTGISHNTLSHMANNKTKRLDVRILFELGEFLGVDYRELFLKPETVRKKIEAEVQELEESIQKRYSTRNFEKE